jgi:tetratricopeptide (TPR) repeat protein
MLKTALAVLALFAFATPLLAQGVKVTLTDGTVVTGTLEGYEQGKYRIRVSNGTVRELEEHLVQEIVLTERPAGDRPSATAQGAIDAARAAFDRGDYDDALRHVGLAMADLDQQRGGLSELVGRIAQAQFERLLEKRDVPALSDALRRTLPVLSPELRRATMTRLAERFSDLHKVSPNETFTASFAEILARLAEAGTIEESLRGTLADRFSTFGQAAFERKAYGQAATFYQGAIRVDPSRREALKTRLFETLLARGRQLLEAGEYRPAGLMARDALGLDPRSDDARHLLDDADLAQLKLEIEASEPGEAIARLREYLPRATRPDHKAWAEQTLARLQANPENRLPGVSAQMRKYFPIRPGRVLVYRRADGEIRERIRTDSVARETTLTRVYFSLEEVYRDYSTRKAYFLEMQKDAILLPAGGEREPLLRFPVRVGDSWTWQSRGRDFRRTVKSVTELVTLGQGDDERRYTDCLVVEFTSTIDREGSPVQITSRSTYAPGVGLIRLDYQDPDFRKFSLELVELHDD